MPTFTSQSQRHVVVVGGGPAANRFVEAMCARGLDAPIPTRLTVLTEEPWLPYDRVALSRALTGTDSEPVDLTLDRQLWDSPAVELRTGTRATAIDTARSTVRTTGPDGEQRLAYDDLVLATGSKAATLPVPGAEAAHVYRTLEDVAIIAAEVQRLRVELGRPPRVVVAGGGLLGLEAAGGLADLGADPTVVNVAGWLMNAQIDEGGGQALGRLIDSAGLRVRCGVMPTDVLVDESGAVIGVALKDDDPIEAEMVVVAIGVRPRDELAREAELEIGPRGGAVIDETTATSVPGVWAIGEVACYDGTCVGLVAPANTMAEVCADRLAGGSATYPGPDTATKLKLAGVDVASFGDAFATAERALEIVYADPARGLYQKIVTTDDAKTLLGGIFVGDATPYTSLRPLLGRELGGEPGAYLSAGGGEAPDTELPDDAPLCSCNNVSVGTVRAAIAGEGPGVEAPCHDIAALKSCTRAGTQCGSCLPVLKKTLDSELTKAGVEVSNAMCEHFPMSRAELFESVRAVGLGSFEEILARFGTGRGCDVCKPTVASILASQHTEYVLDAGRGALQDTNDRALANMQKDGTYSVVPRVPGGEITPAKLAVIARVAETYGLYTKITGALRIDMFGARLEQLPDIWKELVDAGFESGHAYGKALRNVKSCVGSIWCRYGVQDSVSMAIQLELRYRGLRSPHKLKMGVSGCARECAEARAKDVGVIATSDGWNLYVGGNGGANPAHGQLLARDLGDDALITYIDRYLMYYVRTADRLQRTAHWMADLDGGIDHVHQVVVEDSLGIGADLEAAMARHVENYEDEWAATLKDPDRLRRFRSFVNAPTEPDDTTVYVRERDQRRPATEAERDGVLEPGVEPDPTAPQAPVLVAGLHIPVRDQEG
ncbi:nitrite reductase large subunit NirB [Georgenia halophila]|uniref:assimilatory sulfite reductase (ferredoxin) n=1 Tax=Georgenia halophila TaxID=620889 RepID=A0ABP8L6P2_9MICO